MNYSAYYNSYDIYKIFLINNVNVILKDTIP